LNYWQLIQNFSTLQMGAFFLGVLLNIAYNENNNCKVMRILDEEE